MSKTCTHLHVFIQLLTITHLHMGVVKQTTHVAETIASWWV